MRIISKGGTLSAMVGCWGNSGDKTFEGDDAAWGCQRRFRPFEYGPDVRGLIKNCMAGESVKNRDHKLAWHLVMLLVIVLGSGTAHPQESGPSTASPVLTEAVMCEDIQTYAPVNRAVVFGTDIGQVVCFTAFEKISTKTYIYHSWFRKDKLVTTKRLTLNPPEWATFSKILLRQADIGPWRVEVHDQQGNIIKVLRFSITD